MSGIERHAGDGSSSSPPSARTPRLAFPTTRARPTSIVDTTTTSVETTAEVVLSTSPASSIASTGASPRKHTQSAADRLASAQAKDAAAAAKSHRPRTASSTSRSSGEGSRPKLPSLLQATTTARPAAATPVTSTSLDSSKIEEPSSKPSSPPRAATPARDTDTQAMSRRSSRDQSSAPSTKVAGPSTPKKPTPGAPKTTPDAPPLVALLSDSSTSKLIKQGAEAKVYISRIATDNILSWPQPRSSTLQSRKVEPPADVLLKWRFPKTYRHPTLSSSITASRTIMEARALLRCAKAGVAVPAVRCVDEKEGILGLELIAGRSVREWLGGGAEGEDETIVDEEEAVAAEDDEEVLSENDQIKLMCLIGKQLAIMHEADIIHGDLTTSNMMLRPASAQSGASKVDLNHDEVVLIDFGLSSVSAFAEDKAVDLYVLERAFASTHPASESLFKTILDSYAEEVTARSAGKSRSKGGKLNKWEETRRKLEEVRMRGRKRSMVGSVLWKDNWNTRLVFNVQLSVQLECHGLRSLPGLIGSVRSLRPRHALALLPRRSNSTRRAGEGEWHALATRMDDELDHIGSARLLASHTPHESCARTPPNDGPWINLPLVGLRSVVVRNVPLARTAEKLVEGALTRALEVVEWVVPASHGKSKTD
ncbi:Protein kinase domain protein [Kalmanozyma brasiliensis GHG001]|uniref:non-specific serine/threonine protein kinase n=1 Tax=Kalmanozyma brasiliensis (strain GHG001) TaxID=1365824 RepID=V5F0F3_KALBG|nr:Protein kinase domain protein [Kalmanozyma brasiliensis GHG001]EST09773.1 Protein kinase domain protein [Kalmanozyma brasiliensis GHG001]